MLHDVNFPRARCARWRRPAARQRNFPSTVAATFPAGSLVVQEMTPEAFEGVDIALFTCGSGHVEGRCARRSWQPAPS